LEIKKGGYRYWSERGKQGGRRQSEGGVKRDGGIEFKRGV